MRRSCALPDRAQWTEDATPSAVIVARWNARTTKAIRALSLRPVRLTRAKMIKTSAAPTKAGKGSTTSPPRYDDAVAADTTDVLAKSRSRSAAPSKASGLRDTFNLPTPVSMFYVGQNRGGSHMYEYGAPLVGSADASSSMIGRHKKGVSVAMNSDIGELHWR